MVGFLICLRYFRDTLTEGPSRDIFHGSRRAAVGITSLSPLPPPTSSLLLRAGLNATAQLDQNCLRQKETKQTD